MWQEMDLVSPACRGGHDRLQHRLPAQRPVACLVRQQPRGRTILPPVLPKELQGPLRQQHILVLASLGVAEAQDHPLAVDVAELQMDRLGDPQAAGVHQQGADPGLGPANLGQQPADFSVAEDHGELAVPLEADQVQRQRGPPEGVAVEELEGEQVDADRALGPPSLQGDKEASKLLVDQQVGGSSEVPGQVGYGVQVRPLGGLRQGVQLHVLDHPASEFGHGILLLLKAGTPTLGVEEKEHTPVALMANPPSLLASGTPISLPLRRRYCAAV